MRFDQLRCDCTSLDDVIVSCAEVISQAYDMIPQVNHDTSGTKTLIN